MKKKILGVLLATTLLFTLTACGGNDEAKDEPEKEVAEETEKQDKDDDKDEIILATNAEFPPFEYITNDGLVDTYDGIDIAISKEIADTLGKELKVEHMDFSALLGTLSSGKADFVAAGLTSDEEREKNVDFSIPYFTATQYMLVLEDNEDIKSAEDIKEGKTVAALETFTGEAICRDDLGITDLKTYKKAADAVMDLLNERVEVVVVDSHTAIALAANNEGIKIVEDSDIFENEEYAIAVPKGETELLEKINEILEDLIDSGKLDEFVAHYTTENED